MSLDVRWVVSRNRNPVGLFGKDYLCVCGVKRKWVFFQKACWFCSKESAKMNLGKTGKTIITITANEEKSVGGEEK